MMRRQSNPLCQAQLLLLPAAIILATAITAHAAADAPRRLERGRLEAGDVRLPSGEYYDEVPLQGAAGTLVILELHSAEYNAFVQMSPSDTSGPHGDAVWHNNDSQNGTSDARLAVILPVDGDYDIFVTSATAEETGLYELSITVLAEPDRSEAGRLTEDDRTLNTGEYCDYYDFTARQGELWVIDVTSGDFNTYLFARSIDDPEFRVDNDNVQGDERHSQLVMAIPRDGQYFVGVTSAQSGESGGYQIALSATTSIAPLVNPDEPGLIRQGAMGIGLSPGTTSISIPSLEVR